MNGLSQRIIDFLINSDLISARCSKDNEHPTVVIWSAVAADQLAAMLARELPRWVPVEERLPEMESIRRQLAEPVSQCEPINEPIPEPMSQCPECEGRGFMRRPVPRSSSDAGTYSCPQCLGSGKAIK